MAFRVRLTWSSNTHLRALEQELRRRSATLLTGQSTKEDSGTTFKASPAYSARYSPSHRVLLQTKEFVGGLMINNVYSKA